MRKIVISRKGFDSGNVDMPSAFVPGERMVSFPIPATGKSNSADLIRYANICVGGVSMKERIEHLRWNRKKRFGHECCHHDPDLVRDSRPRPLLDGWRGVLGQSGEPQNELDRAKVSVGDLFLFFGWFKQAESGPDGLRFCLGAPDLHVFFGYLQIGEVFRISANQKLPDRLQCFADHPHFVAERLKLQREGATWPNNTAHIASASLSLDSQFPGWGVFRYPRNSRGLVLTKEGRTRAFWSLPDFFRGRQIGRLRRDAWSSPDGAFRSPDIGQQEIIMDADDKLKEWALGIIRAGMRED